MYMYVLYEYIFCAVLYRKCHIATLKTIHKIYDSGQFLREALLDFDQGLHRMGYIILNQEQGSFEGN